MNTDPYLSARLNKLHERLRAGGVDHVILCSAESLRYFCGYSSPVETGISPFTPLLGLLLWIRDERPVFYLADMEPRQDVPDAEVETFVSYTVERPLGAVRDLAEKILRRLSGVSRSKLGMEADSVPASLFEQLSSQANLTVCDVAPTVSALRMVKDDLEIESICRSVALCDAGQQSAKQALRAGISEIELFEEVRTTMEVAAGERMPLLADLVSGPRTSGVGGPPTARKIEPGDPVIVDLAPRLNGYWGDSCNTLIAGDPTSDQSSLFRKISEALGECIAGIRPGILAQDVDSGLRKRLARIGGTFPHHSGHGIGVAYHEEPRIVPYNPVPFEKDMVIALEPGVYFPDEWGMRLEYIIRITDTGAKLLSKFQHVL